MEVLWGTWFLIMLLVLVGIFILPMIFFLISLRDLLRRVSPQNRAMEPDQVWLNLIPLFNLVWMFITIVKVRDSVRSEFYARGWNANGDFGFGVGLASAILALIPLGAFTSLPALICWIIYWVKIVELKNQLAQPYIPSGQAPPPAYMNGPQGPQTGSSAGYSPPPPPPAPTSSSTLNPTPTRFCTSCGASNTSDSQFCGSCGRPIA